MSLRSSLLLYAVLHWSKPCESAPVGVADVTQFVQNHSKTLSPTVHLLKDSGIYPELPKYVIDVILPGGLPYGEQKRKKAMCISLSVHVLTIRPYRCDRLLDAAGSILFRRSLFFVKYRLGRYTGTQLWAAVGVGSQFSSCTTLAYHCKRGMNSLFKNIGCNSMD